MAFRILPAFQALHSAMQQLEAMAGEALTAKLRPFMDAAAAEVAAVAAAELTEAQM